MSITAGRRIEDLWQLLCKGAYWRRGPITMAAIGAVDTALWDIKGKVLNAPVCQVLGGASRDAVTVYGHASGHTIEKTVDAVGRYVARGYRAVRAQCTVPAVTRTYGISPTDAYEPAERDALAESTWSSERYITPHPNATDRVFPHAYSFASVMMHPGEAAGLGVDINEALAATYPYQRAYLPIARLMDGTMHDW